MALLDGSLGGSSTVNEFGPKFGAVSATDNELKGATITSNVAGVTVKVTAGAASGKNGENAVWDAAGKELTLNLNKSTTYTQEDIDKLIANATVPKSATAVPAEINIKLVNGIMSTTDTPKTAATTATVGGTRTTGTFDLSTIASTAGTAATTGKFYSDSITLTANTYGADTASGKIAKVAFNSAGVEAGKESAVLSKTTADNDTLTINLATGKEYSEADIEKILADAGLDYTVKLTSTAAAAPMSDQDGVIMLNKAAAIAAADMTAGLGVGKDADLASGKGLTFQIGANGVEDQRVTLNVNDMSSKAIGVADCDVSTRDAANEAINKVDAAVKTVSMQRAGLGALQNRLEYTVNNLTTTNENLTNAESQIRDTDMATEMINYTKFNILQQASQAMLAQANQQPQAVLQLLG